MQFGLKDPATVAVIVNFADPWTLNGSLVVSVNGHGVASGTSNTLRIPQARSECNRPFFKALGLDLSSCFCGTLNLDFSPLEVSLADPDHCFQRCNGLISIHLRPSRFGMFRLEKDQVNLSVGWVYYPHPETKQRHWQSATTLELLAPRLSSVCNGSEAQIHDPHGRIKLVNTVRLRARLLEFLKFRVLSSQQHFSRPILLKAATMVVVHVS